MLTNNEIMMIDKLIEAVHQENKELIHINEKLACYYLKRDECYNRELFEKMINDSECMLTIKETITLITALIEDIYVLTYIESVNATKEDKDKIKFTIDSYNHIIKKLKDFLSLKNDRFPVDKIYYILNTYYKEIFLK